MVTKLFQQPKTNARTPKYVLGQKKTIYKKDGRFVKENTEGATAYQVDTLGEESKVVKTSLQERLTELREKSKIKKTIEAEKEKAEKQLTEHLIQCSSQSPEFLIPSQLGTPDNTIMEAVLSPEKSKKKKKSKSTNSDSNNNTPVVSPKKSQREVSQAISLKKKSFENDQLVAC